MSRVFLLSDDLRMRRQIELELSRSLHVVRAAGTNPQIVGEAHRFSPDVIILDCADERAAARVRLELVRDAQLVGVPLVAIACSSEEAHALGAQALLPRPLQAGDVTAVLVALVPSPSAQQL